MNMNDNVLKPCPFCWGAARIGDQYEGSGQRPSKCYPVIRCDTCNLCVDFNVRHSYDMVKFWNGMAIAEETAK
jgi:hypothetical protein